MHGAQLLREANNRGGKQERELCTYCDLRSGKRALFINDRLVAFMFLYEALLVPKKYD